MESTDKFDLWAVVELFGHSKISGKCTEQNIAGSNMLRVDVPETKQAPAFTRFLGSAAIYAINPVTEEIALAMAERINVQPVQSYDIGEVVKKHRLLLMQTDTATVPSGPPHSNNDRDDDRDDDNEM